MPHQLAANHYPQHGMARSAAIMTDTSDQLRHHSQQPALGRAYDDVAQLCRQILSGGDQVQTMELMTAAERLMKQLDENLKQQADQWNLLAIVVGNLATTLGHLDHAAAHDLDPLAAHAVTQAAGTKAPRPPHRPTMTTADIDHTGDKPGSGDIVRMGHSHNRVSH